MDSKEKAQQFVDVLNRAFESDPSAIHALMCNRVPCNGTLAGDPTIQVGIAPVEGPNYIVGTLGLINGLLGLDHVVAMKWDNDNGGKFMGFCVVEPVFADTDQPAIDNG